MSTFHDLKINTRFGSSEAFDDELDHVYCCRDENIALCGTDVVDAEVIDTDEIVHECVVCADLAEMSVCARTGHPCPEDLS